MYLKLTDKEKEIVCKASDTTFTDYELDGNYIKAENLISIIEDLLIEIDHQTECYEDLQRDLEDNYKPISKAEQYEISDRDFV